MLKWIGGIIGAIIAGVIVYNITENTDISINDLSKPSKEKITKTLKKSEQFHVSLSSDTRDSIGQMENKTISIEITIFSDSGGSTVPDANVKIESECGIFPETDSNIGWGKTDQNGKLRKSLIFGRTPCKEPRVSYTGSVDYPYSVQNIYFQILVNRDGYKDWNRKMVLNLPSGIAKLGKG